MGFGNLPNGGLFDELVFCVGLGHGGSVDTVTLFALMECLLAAFQREQ